MNNIQMCRKNFCVICYEVEVWPMLYSAVKFRENMVICKLSFGVEFSLPAASGYS